MENGPVLLNLLDVASDMSLIFGASMALILSGRSLITWFLRVV